MAAHTFHVNLGTSDARVTRALNISPEDSWQEETTSWRIHICRRSDLISQQPIISSNWTF